MSAFKSKTKGKRVLPNIPLEGFEGKRGVTFNAETIETSIGGSITPVRTKGDPLSPVNRLSNDESSLRSENSESWEEDNSISVRDQSDSSLLKSHSMQSGVNTVMTSKGVSVEVSVKRDGSYSDSDKENSPVNLEKGTFLVNTPVKGPNHLFSYAYGSESTEKNIESLRSYTPSPGMKVRGHDIPLRRHTLDAKLLGTPECYSVVQLDKNGYDFGFDSRRNGDGEDSCSVTVAVRVRPYSQRELSFNNAKKVVSMVNNETTVTTDMGAVHRFAYDFSFSSFDKEDPDYASQDKVYCSLARPLLGKAFEGYNTCLFAYGQTGSGKSYSIMGHGEDIGIIPRFCEELFSRAEVAKELDKAKIHVEISFFEIYNEKIHDLLATNNKQQKQKKTTLRVREHPTLGPYVEGLSTFVVNSFEDVEGWITLGNKNRATAATGMNDKSSRSHSVFTIVLTQTKTEMMEGQEHDHSITSKINLVDLAGSERQSQAQTSGERLREGANINKSLLSLGKVISQLAEQTAQTSKRKKIFIPYRDSVLTWLLKESLGGNSKTAMIATISPANHHIEETLSTLRYAQTARSIVNTARVNEDPKAKLIRELRDENERLRASMLSGNDDMTAACVVEIGTLREKLLQKEREVEEITKSWQERLRQSEERKQEEAKHLEKAGVTLKVDNRLPNLVNLNEDPQLSEMLLYNIKEGVTQVGRMMSTSTHDIQLTGALIADNHCTISNLESEISITPLGDAPTYINGNLISDTTVIHHGDRVILGGDHYFRFNHPIEVQRTKRDKPGSSQNPLEVKDFEYAKVELMRVQEGRLQEARQREEEMLEEVEQAKKDADQEKVMREESDEKVKEAENIIHKLKKQKMMLEQEVIAGRKRQQMEAEAVLKASSELNSRPSRILELLQTQSDMEAERLEQLKQRRNDYNDRMKTTGSPTTVLVQVSSGKMDLYKIALQVREANKISQYLKKALVFEREDFLDGETVKTIIKVLNTKLNVCTHWNLHKFEDKLMLMRDLYQNESESSGDDEVFNDPQDHWGRDSISSPISPKRCGKKSVPSPSLRQALLSSSQNMSHTLQDTTCMPYTGPGVGSLCKDLIILELDQMKSSSLEESIADKVLHGCQALKSCLVNAVQLPVAMETNNNTCQQSDVLQLTCIQMTNAFSVIRSTCTTWASMYQSLDSALIHDLLSKMSDQVKVIGAQIVRFLQGVEGDIGSMMVESTGRLHDAIHTVCKLTGELALATDTHMLYFQDTQRNSTDMQIVSADISQSFFGGCETFIDKTLQGALRTVEEYEMQAQTLSDTDTDNLHLGDLPQNVEICVCSCKDLLVKCREVQVEIDTSMLDRASYAPVQFCNGNYRRSQALISHISTLVDGVGLLIQYTEPVVQGRESDIRKISKCGSMIEKCAGKLTSVSGRDLNKLRRSTSDIDTCEQSLISNTQIEQLQYVSSEVLQAVTTLTESVQSVMDLERAATMSTPRSKRLLPSHPPGMSPRTTTGPVKAGLSTQS